MNFFESFSISAFEADFCQMKATVDVLKSDTQRVSNSEVEISRLWHTIQTETKSIYDNRQMIEDLKTNMTSRVNITFGL